MPDISAKNLENQNRGILGNGDILGFVRFLPFFFVQPCVPKSIDEKHLKTYSWESQLLLVSKMVLRISV